MVADVPERGSSCGSPVISLLLRDGPNPATLDSQSGLDLDPSEDVVWAGSCGSVEEAEVVCSPCDEAAAEPC